MTYAKEQQLIDKEIIKDKVEKFMTEVLLEYNMKHGDLLHVRVGNHATHVNGSRTYGVTVEVGFWNDPEYMPYANKRKT